MIEAKTYPLGGEEIFPLEEGTCNCEIDIRIRPIIYIHRACLIGDFGLPACKECHKLLPVKELL